MFSNKNLKKTFRTNWENASVGLNNFKPLSYFEKTLTVFLWSSRNEFSVKQVSSSCFWEEKTKNLIILMELSKSIYLWKVIL